MEEIYFFDSYAVIAMFDGKASYQPYRECRAIVTKLNLFEIDYCLRRRGMPLEGMARVLSQYSEYLADYDLNSIRHAVALKLTNKNMSMTDCIGYRVACEYGVRFLTGDREFKGMPNVEFVK